jgi:hypothetical protein
MALAALVWPFPESMMACQPAVPARGADGMLDLHTNVPADVAVACHSCREGGDGRPVR